MNKKRARMTDTPLLQAGTLAFGFRHEEAVRFAREDLVVAQKAYQKTTPHFATFFSVR